MRQDNQQLEQYRVINGPMRSKPEDGNNGVFIIRNHPGSVALICIASDEGGWEHVSVEATLHPSSKPREPHWDEMCFVKKLFWTDQETVIQYHPTEENYVNVHPYVLHLWKPTNQEIPLPPRIFV